MVPPTKKAVGKSYHPGQTPDPPLRRCPNSQALYFLMASLWFAVCLNHLFPRFYFIFKQGNSHTSNYLTFAI